MAIDRNIAARADMLVFCEPSLLAEDSERLFIRKYVKEANVVFEGLTELEAKQTAYIVTHRHKFKLEKIKLPYYWSEKLSLSYGKVQKRRLVLSLKS